MRVIKTIVDKIIALKNGLVVEKNKVNIFLILLNQIIQKNLFLCNLKCKTKSLIKI